MRVIAGEFKGRRLTTVKGLKTRPILDRVKESLFSILTADVIDARVLDLYSGAGTIGIEALSRGAAHVIMVDISNRAFRAARENIERLNIRNRVEFRQSDAKRALNALSAEDTQFDLIFFDPPYFGDHARRMLPVLRKTGLLAEGGLLIYRHHKKESVERAVEEWHIFRQHKVGETILTFLQLPPEPDDSTMEPT